MRRPTRLAAFLIAAPLLSLRAQADAPLVDTAVTRLLHEGLSGEIAKDHVIAITRHHRIQGSRGFRSAGEYVIGQLRRYGFAEQQGAPDRAHVESFKSDGRVVYQTWQSPSGWDITSGELRMVEPYDERIVGYPEVAMSVITYSNAGDVTAELVWVGAGTRDADYAGKDVRGKLVLATGYGGAVHRLAVLKYGARAVVCYLDDERAKEYPDMLQYTGMWPTTEELERVTFGFNLTNRQGTKLRGLLERGQRVVLRGRVQGAGLEPYFMDVITATIRGSERPDEELVFSAHLDHPKESANDNASGSAALLDIARTLKELVDGGRLPRPKRTIRFLWVPEFYGTMAYIDAHAEFAGPALGGKWLANINMDMVGEHPELLHSYLIITRTPSSIPSALNDVIESAARTVDGLDVRTPRGSLSAFNWRVTPYSGGSDHMMFIDRKIPGVMFSHTDYTHHTSEDTPDKVDPVELERCEIVAAASMLYLANLEPEQAIDLVQLTAANGARRLGERARRARRVVAVASEGSPASAWPDARLMLDHALREEQAAVRSVLGFNAQAAVGEAVKDAEAALAAQHAQLTRTLGALATANGFRERTAAPRAGAPGRDARVPVRLTRGPIASGLPESRLPAEAAAWYRTAPAARLSGDVRFELLNFVDGARSVSDIRDALTAEFGPVPVEAVGRFVSDLVTVGVLRWK